MKTVKIYKLIDPISLEVRYVGKTEKTLKHRLSMHVTTSIKNKNKTHKEAWITGLSFIGLRPLIELIEEVNFEDWQEKEIYWITQFGNLTNTCSGGIGGTGRVYSESERLHRSVTMKKLIDEGKIDYTERALKISQSHKGKILSEVTKEKLRQCNLGKKQSREQKLKTARKVLRIDKEGNKIVFDSLAEGSMSLGAISYKEIRTCRGNISSVCTGRIKSYKGYKWQYYEDIVDSL
jgi:hypothetical protein